MGSDLEGLQQSLVSGLEGLTHGMADEAFAALEALGDVVKLDGEWHARPGTDPHGGTLESMLMAQRVAAAERNAQPHAAAPPLLSTSSLQA